MEKGWKLCVNDEKYGKMKMMDPYLCLLSEAEFTVPKFGPNFVWASYCAWEEDTA